jgi:hypothetical protein
MTMRLGSGWGLAAWLLLDAACLAWLIRDLRTRNAHLMRSFKRIFPTSDRDSDS